MHAVLTKFFYKYKPGQIKQGGPRNAFCHSKQEKRPGDLKLTQGHWHLCHLRGHTWFPIKSSIISQ